ncbi:MAG: WD40 repeat domain-containing protein, partial [Acidobacteria bacterium]|nr:WD40 repeat domain-containing protein [Acidobacteriota bacterium]
AMDFFVPAPAVRLARFSPDSQFIVLTNSDFRVEKWSVEEKRRVWVRDVAIRDGCVQTQISPDGNTLACINWNYELSLIDVPTAVTWWSKKNFFVPSGMEAFALTLGRVLGVTDLHLVNMEFSPDGKYFLAGHRGSAAGVDLIARHDASMPGRTRAFLSEDFAFVGADKLFAREVGYSKGHLVHFPSGEKIDTFEIGGSRMSPVTHGDYVLLHPLRDYPIGVFDFSKKGIGFYAKRQSAMDVFDGIVVTERINGEVGLYPVSQTTPIANTALPQSPLGPLTAAALSPDQRWLALSGRSRGAIWDLSRNTRVSHLRSFRSAWFEDDGTCYAEFPKYNETQHSVVRIDPRTNATDVTRPLAEADIAQHGAYITAVNAKYSTLYVRSSGDLEFQDVKTGKKLWSRHFDRDFPTYAVNSSSETAVLGWDLSSGGGREELQRFPSLRGRTSKRDLLVEVVNAKTGTDIGAVAVNAGSSPRSGVVDATADGGWLAVVDGRTRTIVYYIASGEEKMRVFGSHPTLSAASGLLAVDEESGAVGLYELQTGAKQQEYSFAAPVSFKQFSRDGTQLLVVTKAQYVYRIDLKARPAQQEPQQ